jgi:hypothetical protein
MIVIGDVPGLNPAELAEALQSLLPPGSPGLTTGHGGFVVDEATAGRFLDLYRTALATPTRPEPVAPSPAATPATRRTTRR